MAIRQQLSRNGRASRLSFKENDIGLHNQTGSFTCVAYSGKNPLYRHGALRVSQDRRYLTYADGAPFFWLGDTDVYMPVGGEVELKMDQFAQSVTAECFDPKTGTRTALGRAANRDTKKFKAVGEGDRVLVLSLREGNRGSKK